MRGSRLSPAVKGCCVPGSSPPRLSHELAVSQVRAGHLQTGLNDPSVLRGESCRRGHSELHGSQEPSTEALCSVGPGNSQNFFFAYKSFFLMFTGN